MSEHDRPLTLAEGIEREREIVNREPLTPAKQFAEFMRNPGSPALHNFVGDKMAIYRLTAIACGNAIKADDIGTGEVIPVRHWYCHWVEMTANVGGEVNDNIRTAIITPEHKVFAFVSGGVAQSIQQIVDAFGFSVLDPPLLLSVVSSKTRRGYTTKMLVPAIS